MSLDSKAHLFLCRHGRDSDAVPASLESAYTCSWWRPSAGTIRPEGQAGNRFWVWWLFHHGRIFKNQAYTIYVIQKGRRLVHRSCVFPGFFRFPFIASDDVQVGDIWTDPEHRRKGLASYALHSIVSAPMLRGRKIWYVVAEDNRASIRVAERAGFVRYGEGVRKERFGSGLFAVYVIRHYL